MTSLINFAQEKLNRDLCRELALGYNQDVKSAKLQTKSIESTKDAFGKDYYPKLGLMANYEYIGKPYVIENIIITKNQSSKLTSKASGIHKLLSISLHSPFSLQYLDFVPSYLKPHSTTEFSSSYCSWEYIIVKH